MSSHEGQHGTRDRKRKNRAPIVTKDEESSTPSTSHDDSHQEQKQRKLAREAMRNGKSGSTPGEAVGVGQTSVEHEGGELEGLTTSSTPTTTTTKVSGEGETQPSEMDTTQSTGHAEGGNERRRRGGRSSHNKPVIHHDASDIIYRIMHGTPRTDELEVVRCRFGPAECERAAKYFDDTYMTNPLRRLRFQIGCSAASGLSMFFPKIGFHWQSLRQLDLSRNDISAEELTILCSALHLHEESAALEVLDLSYNRRVGNAGAVHVLDVTKHNRTLRALILKSTSIDDSGAPSIWEYLKRREQPDESERHVWGSLSLSVPRRAFFINLNENLIGANGTRLLGKRLPDFVSITIVKQRVKRQQ